MKEYSITTHDIVAIKNGDTEIACVTMSRAEARKLIGGDLPETLENALDVAQGHVGMGEEVAYVIIKITN